MADLPAAPAPRRLMPATVLDEAEYKRRFLSAYPDPAFDPLRDELARLADAAWSAYSAHRKSPRTRKAGEGFADPDYDLAVDWLEAHEAIRAAQAAYDEPSRPSRVLIVNGSSRSEHTCPGESSKSWRLIEIAQAVFAREPTIATEILDLSRLTSEYGRHIHPCKGCFSTAAALCHWPCSCYPNYSLGQTQDWMNEIYPMWVAADAVLIVSPVYWLQAPSPLKLMIDRMVCADGGNPDPTSTHGKRPQEAKALELAGWSYPRHLAGRLFGLVVHGDAEGLDATREALTRWLTSMQLTPAGEAALLGRYIGYYGPYATSHEALDQDEAVQEETRNAARALIEAVHAKGAGPARRAGEGLKDPRPK